MDIIKVQGDTYCIDTGMTYIPFYKMNDEEIIMLDSGWAKQEQKGISQLLEKNNMKVVAIICSHSHIDHVGNNLYLKNKYDCMIAMPEYEAIVCSSMANLKSYYSDLTLSHVKKYYKNLVFKTDMMIQDDQNEIQVCGKIFKIYHTPGHSPAHICIITPDEVAYIGDTLISYEVMKGAKLPYAFILTEDLKSKKKLNDLKYKKYIVAHKGIYDDIKKLIIDNIDFYTGRAKDLYGLIECGMTMEDIVKHVIEDFKISVRNIPKYSVIKRMTRCYVDYLYEMGMLKLILDNEFVRYTK